MLKRAILFTLSQLATTVLKSLIIIANLVETYCKAPSHELGMFMLTKAIYPQPSLNLTMHRGS